jgi:hypothetical protein
MQLSEFIKDLFTTGNVTVAGQLVPFDENDLQFSGEILKARHDTDRLEMPQEAPDFSAEAALWAAQYFYRAVQFTLLRDQDETALQQHLKKYPGEVTPKAVYSADLTLRHLHDLADLAKGLSPEDVLVQQLGKTACEWPFSSVGMNVTLPLDDEVILQHVSLRGAYIDRIIKAKDTRRISPAIREWIDEALGDHTETLWPEWKHLEHSLLLNGNNITAPSSAH